MKGKGTPEIGPADQTEKPKEKEDFSMEDQIKYTVVIDIAQELKPDPTKCVIHRVPRLLRKINETAYTPQVVSIGPFHCGRKELQAMEFHKKTYFEEFRSKFHANHHHKKGKKDLESFVKKRFHRILASYAKGSTILLEKQEMLEKIILRDACFIIELFLRNETDACEDFIFTTPWIFNAIMLDLLLLENQIPFFLLQELYDYAELKIPNTEVSSTKDEGDQNWGQHRVPSEEPLLSDATPTDHCHPFLKLTCSYFTNYFSGMTEKELFIKDKGIKHFTDLLRQSMFPEGWNSPDIKDNLKPKCNLYNASKLDKAGVKFKQRENARLADIKTTRRPLSKCVAWPCLSLQLQLPQFAFDDDTERLLRNVMALEQCLYPSDLFICNYVKLMDDLINTTEDVRFLASKEIISNDLGSEEAVAKLVNTLCQEITVQDVCIHASDCEELNAYCDSKWNSAKATLKRVYFKDLWTGSSTIVGLFVLIFTISSTIKSLFFS